MQILGRVVALALLALPLMAASPPRIAPDDPAANLNALFSRLRAAKDPAEAQVVEGMIISIWATSPSDTANLIYQRGVVALGAGDKELALDLFTACTSLQPDFGEAWHQLGVANFALNANDEAMIDLEHALAIEPRNYGALMQLAAIFSIYGNQHASLQALRRAYALNPHIDGLGARIEAMAREVEGQGI
jgi:tetratricopeptide (TPR) repeat protein